MTYLQPRSIPGQRARRIAISVILGAAAIAGGIQWLSPWFFPGVFLSVARPFWQAEFSIRSGAVRPPAQILAENEELKRRLAELETRMASSSAGELIQENTELKAEFGRASTTPKLLAAVLARPPIAPYDELVIDVGKDKGAGSTTLVYAANNVIVGRVRESSAHASKVILFTSPGQTYPVLIGPTHIPATAVGQGGGQYRADVAHGAAVHEGDPVSDSSLSGGALGSVVYVSTDPSSPFDTVFIAPSVNPYQLRWVFLDVRF
ncbi:MAG: Rod shape-determining protein MreC [Candidatus Parcubacteria bacterium]|nr:Rod shape-determining protein MreC [Candidatus Parcubacteria bacterium]